MQTMKRFLDNPYVNLFVAVALLYSGISEGWETLQEDLVNFDAKAHHGIMLFGFYKMLHAIPDLFEGVERVHSSRKTLGNS